MVQACAGFEVSWMVQAKVSPYLYSAWGHPACTIKQSAEGCYLCRAWRFPDEAKM